MRLKLIPLIILLIIPLIIEAQTTKLLLNPGIKLPKDSIEKEQLISTLNDFLIAAQQPNEQNKFVFPAEKIETFILLDEINGIEKSERFKDDFFFKPYLTNAVLLKDNNYLVQISYIGTKEGIPMLKASFELIAHKVNNTFLYSSLLIKHTKTWKALTVGNCTFHYKTTVNKAKANEYEKSVLLFDKKLNSINKITELYCCDDFIELQRLIGVDYKFDYNAQAENTFSSLVENKKLIVLGESNSGNFNDFDPHDLWHDRLSLVISRDLVNKPIDEGCAYLYGGSWGISWKEIVRQFKAKVASNKQANWADYKENPFNFGDGKYLMADYVVNGLIIQKLEKEKGFSAVWEFLNCGKYEKGNDNYYKTLEKLTGITKASYNEKVWELVNEM